MRPKKYLYYNSAKLENNFPDQKQDITYSFNDEERTIIGIMKEAGDFIFLYEYRGNYIGIEFFISFSKNSTSYKLIEVKERVTG